MSLGSQGVIPFYPTCECESRDTSFINLKDYFRISSALISRLVVNLHVYDDKQTGADENSSRCLTWVARAVDDFAAQSRIIFSPHSLSLGTIMTVDGQMLTSDDRSLHAVPPPSENL